MLKYIGDKVKPWQGTTKRKLSMQPDQNKLNAVLQETEPVARPSVKEGSVKVMGKNLTMLDTIGLAVLIMFPLGLFLGQQIVNDSLRQKLEARKETQSN